MPNRIIKESILTSPTLAKLSAAGERHFYRCLLRSDDWGCFESTPDTLGALCYPSHRGLRGKRVRKWNDELEKVGLIRRWRVGEREYAVFLSFDTHNRYGVDNKGRPTRHRRKTPEPPEQMITDDSRR